jgi:hypothetical protein
VGRVTLLAFAFLLAAPCPVPPDAVTRLPTRYSVLRTLHPCFLVGDFDGDGVPDIALQVRERETGKVGIAVEHSSTKTWFIIGAGVKMSNGDDNFDWMDSWRATINDITHHGGAILAEKSGTVSGMLFWNGREYRWQQLAD